MVPVEGSVAAPGVDGVTGAVCSAGGCVADPVEGCVVAPDVGGVNGNVVCGIAVICVCPAGG